MPEQKVNGENGDDQSDMIEAAEKVAKAKTPTNRCSNQSNVSAIEDSGRIMYRGADMLCVTINGIQMFTFYEIIGKISPHVKRAAIGNRFTRLKATKHACNRAEVKLIKELGGTDSSCGHCTLVARADVEKYCEKYEDNYSEQINENTSSLKPEIGRKDKKGKTSSSKARARKLSDSKLLSSDANAKRKVDEELNELFIDNSNSSISKHSKEDAVRKRKRQTQFKQAYQCYSDVTEDGDQKGKNTSVTENDAQQLKNNVSVDVNSNIVDGCENSSELLEETLFDYDVLNPSYSDDIDNTSEIIEPRSPTLLLKRSQNKWHIAKAMVREINVEVSESELVSGMVKKYESSKNSVSKSEMEKVTDKVKFPRTFSNTTSKEPFGKKVDDIDSALPLTTVNKLAKKRVKKINNPSKRRKTCDTTKDDKKAKLESNTSSEKGATEIKLCTIDGKSGRVENINLDERKPNMDILKSKSLVENKEKQENTTKKDKVVKKNRKRRIEINNFRLVETIPYPSLLMVKDGDLCPSNTMVYNHKNYLPGCCHALWRWRLGKPLKIPGRSPVKTRNEKVPVDKAQDDPYGQTTKVNEDEQSSPEGKQVEHCQFENMSEDETQLNKARSVTPSYQSKNRRASLLWKPSDMNILEKHADPRPVKTVTD